MNRAKKESFDYTRLSEPDDLVFLCLPYWLQMHMLDMTKRMLWSRTWQDDSGNYPPLTESDRDKIAYGIYLLSLEECDMVINVTTGANNQTVECGGGSGGSGCSSPPPWQGLPGQCYPVEQYPPPITDPNYPAPDNPPDDIPLEDWQLLRCRQANYAWQKIYEWLGALANLSTNLATVAVVLLAIWGLAPAVILTLVGSGILQLAGLLAAWSAYVEAFDELFEFAQEYWVDNRDEIVCKFYNATDVAILRNDVFDPMLTAILDYAELRDWWPTVLAERITSLFGAAMPLGLFLAPFRLIAPASYVGSVNCANCGLTPPDDDGLWAFDRVYVSAGEETFANIEGNDGFTLSGSWEAGTTTDVRVRAQRLETTVSDVWSAVSFVLSISGEGGSLGYGAENNQSLLTNLDIGGGVLSESVCIVREGYPPPSGTWDNTIIVPDEDYLLPYFLLGRFTFHPPTMSCGMTVEDWQHYEDLPT